MQKIFISLLLLFFSISTFVHAVESNLKQPLMSMTDINGKIYKVKGTEQGLNIEGMKGKVIFLEFFGHQCPPCLASIPHLIDLKNKHKDKLAIVAIEVQGYNSAQLKTFAKEKGMNYTVVPEESAAALVEYVRQRAQWRGSIPFLVALDTQGNVQFVQAGMLPESSLEQLIKDLSTKPKASTEKKAIKTSK